LNILTILAHPTEGSFNHAIAETAINSLKKIGHEVIFHDLYKEKFDPILLSEEIPKDGIFDNIIAQHCNELKECDGIIIIHPNWWGQPPAILKGWIDRVIRPGIAYEFKDGDNGEGVPIGLLKAKVGIVFNTANTSEVRETNIFKDPLETIWKNCIFDLCEIKTFYRKMFRIIVSSSEQERITWLKEVDDAINQYFH
jgi:NAD(P)H dehydrogenase (quinone)